jgi:hypothetical protein
MPSLLAKHIALRSCGQQQLQSFVPGMSPSPCFILYAAENLLHRPGGLPENSIVSFSPYLPDD